MNWPHGRGRTLLGRYMAPSGASGSASRSSWTGILKEIFSYETTDDATSSVSINQPEGRPVRIQSLPRGKKRALPLRGLLMRVPMFTNRYWRTGIGHEYFLSFLWGKRIHSQYTTKYREKD
ncbi:hypothetical protein ACLOJK_022995 [Asimina triloba]